MTRSIIWPPIRLRKKIMETQRIPRRVPEERIGRNLRKKMGKEEGSFRHAAEVTWTEFIDSIHGIQDDNIINELWNYGKCGSRRTNDFKLLLNKYARYGYTWSKKDIKKNVQKYTFHTYGKRKDTPWGTERRTKERQRCEFWFGTVWAPAKMLILLLCIETMIKNNLLHVSILKGYIISFWILFSFIIVH